MSFDGIIRTPMGIYVLRDDVLLSRTIERENRLDTRDNLVEIASFAHLIPEGGVCVDAGAFLGDHVLSYSQIVGMKGLVYAFEPHPLTYEALMMNVNRLANVTAFNYGLSDRGAIEGFNQDLNAGGSFFGAEGASRASTQTLDGFLLPELRRCDFIHLDAEGYETRILCGGRTLIEKFHPLMLIEVCDKHLRRAGSSESELAQLITEMGYKMTTIPTHLESELRDDLCVWGGN